MPRNSSPAPRRWISRWSAPSKRVSSRAAVVLIGHNGHVVYQKAYGSRALVPQREPMTLDTIFDAASLTKVIATTPAIMRLFEQGPDPPQRSGDEIPPRISGRTQRHHHPQPDDAFLGTSAGSGSEAGLERLPDRHSTRPHRQTRRPSRRSFRLQRHQFHFARRNRASAYWKDAERIRARKLLPAARHARNDVLAAGIACARALLPPKSIRPPASPCAAKCMTIPRATWAASRAMRACLPPLRDLAKFAQMMLDGRPRQRRPALQRRDGSEVHFTAIPTRPADFARPGLGYRFALFEQSRRIVSDRLLRPHRIHRHFDVD